MYWISSHDVSLVPLKQLKTGLNSLFSLGPINGELVRERLLLQARSIEMCTDSAPYANTHPPTSIVWAHRRLWTCWELPHYLHHTSTQWPLMTRVTPQLLDRRMKQLSLELGCSFEKGWDPCFKPTAVSGVADDVRKVIISAIWAHSDADAVKQVVK